MHLPDSLHDWVKKQGYGSIEKQIALSGGCISSALCLHCTTGAQLFLKCNQQVTKDFFHAEAKSLQILSHANGGPRTPQVFLVEDTFILLEHIEVGKKSADYWEVFGRSLAHLHDNYQPNFGFEFDTYCGSTEQNNSWQADGYSFFIEQRLLHLTRLNKNAGKLTQIQVQNIEAVCHKLSSLIPKQSASLIHGDLWSGNAHTDVHGNPVLIDPAAYYGWAEADLAMTSMFGRFPDTFYSAYREIRPLEQGWLDRFPLYNLYHYLNHLYLFGGSYSNDVMSITKHFA